MINQDRKVTGRQKRMQHFKEMHAKSGLNLVSLMDIFTILVFFLLVNSSSQQLPSSKDVKLPTTVATKLPRENLIIAVTKDSILVDGKKVAAIPDVLTQTEPVISGLIAELQFHASKSTVLQVEEDVRRSVTIMGDENMPYDLLSKILASCRQASYTNIAFAAFQQAKGKA